MLSLLEKKVHSFDLCVTDNGYSSLLFREDKYFFFRYLAVMLLVRVASLRGGHAGNK